jgi:AcrR family transcriptional regulator
VTAPGTVASTARARRRYDNTLRRERAGQTRERIVAAGAELLRASSIRDWNALTIRSVAERAGVHERTVYRHFANERALRDAVMHRLEQDAGVDLAHMQLDDVADVAVRTLQYVSAYNMQPRPPLDPTLDEAKHRQHEALLAAVAHHATRWSPEDRRIAAAMLDVLWAVGSYERVVGDWDLDRDEAIRGITWVIGLVTESVRGNRAPTAARPAPHIPAGAARRAARRDRE